MKRICRGAALLAGFVFLFLCCSGCFSSAESRQAKQGKDMMETYLKTRGAKKVSVDTARTSRERTAPDRIEMTDFVFGTYRIDGQEYEYWVDVGTGEIFTSERLAEFEAVCYDLMLSELGVDPAHSVGLCNAYFLRAPRDSVMPVEIEDPEAYARSFLHGDEFSVVLWAVCGASEAPPNRWTEEDTADWNRDEARVCVTPAGEALPAFGNGVNLGYSYFRDFTGDKYELSSEAVRYTPAA